MFWKIFRPFNSFQHQNIHKYRVASNVRFFRQSFFPNTSIFQMNVYRSIMTYETKKMWGEAVFICLRFKKHMLLIFFYSCWHHFAIFYACVLYACRKFEHKIRNEWTQKNEITKQREEIRRKNVQKDKLVPIYILYMWIYRTMMEKKQRRMEDE